MEPRIHYAKTSDGVNIAYWTPWCDNWQQARTSCSPTSTAPALRGFEDPVKLWEVRWREA